MAVFLFLALRKAFSLISVNVTLWFLLKSRAIALPTIPAPKTIIDFIFLKLN